MVLASIKDKLLNMEETKRKKLIGTIIRNEREKRGLTQEELSARISLDQSNLSNIENGKNYPSFATFCALVEVLDIEPNEFLGFLKFGSNTKEIIDIKIQELVKKYSPELKENLFKVLKKIKD